MRIKDLETKAPLTSIATGWATTVISTSERNPPVTDKKEASYAFRLPPSLYGNAPYKTSSPRTRGP